MATSIAADGTITTVSVAPNGTIYQYGWDGATITRPDGSVGFIEQDGGDELGWD